MVDDLCLATLESIESSQEDSGGIGCVRGEFRMTLRCPEPKTDYNFLTGYALLHLITCVRLLGDHLSAETREQIAAILNRADEVPAAYQTRRGTTNWYHGKLSGDHIPPNFPWPGGQVLSLYDDLDDTAVNTMLTCLHPWRVPPWQFSDSLFTDYSYKPEFDRLGIKSLKRLQMAGVNSSVYMTWALSPDAPWPEKPSNWMKLPPHNSIELVTAANIWTALTLRSASPSNLKGFSETRRFVNRLAGMALDRLIYKNDFAIFELCAPYYPRVPFAPIAFLLRDHMLSGGTLLCDETLNKIADAVKQVSPHATGRDAPFAAPAYWANAAGWCIRLGLIPVSFLPQVLAEVSALAHSHFDSHVNSWPDFVFFLGAHIGDYSGTTYSNCFMVETLSLLAEVS